MNILKKTISLYKVGFPGYTLKGLDVYLEQLQYELKINTSELET